MKKNNNAILKLCIAALMTAAFVVLDLYASLKPAPNITITFSGLPLLIAAIYLGPVAGMSVGLLGSFITQMFSEYGLTATTVLWIIPDGMRGLIMGLILIAFKRKITIPSLYTGVIVSSLTVTVLNTVVMYVDSKIYGYYTYAYVFGASAFRLISSLLTAIAFIFVLVPITDALNKQKLITIPKKFKE